VILAFDVFVSVLKAVAEEVEFQETVVQIPYIDYYIPPCVFLVDK